MTDGQRPTRQQLLDRLTELHDSVPRPFVPRRPGLAEELRDLADVADGLGEAALGWDSYGEKGLVAEIERRTAELLGTEAAAYFPSGVMAQQAALRVWCERAGTRRVALPDLSHLLVHEEDGPRRLHGFEVEHLTTGAVTPTREDIEAIRGPLAAVLVELPLRDGGYLLPEWDDLVAVSRACRERGAALHLDGARLWESAPYYGRPLADLAALADSTYVSFYKGLAGLAGAALAGGDDVVAEARVWRRRHGGTLYTIAPFALAAIRGLERNLARMGECHAYAVALGGRLAGLGFRTVPEPVQATALRLFAPAGAEALLERAVAIAEADGLALPGRWTGADAPGWSFTEITVSPAFVDAWPDPDEAASALARLLG